MNDEQVPTGEAGQVREPSQLDPGHAGGPRPAQPEVGDGPDDAGKQGDGAKIKFTSKIRRGLALVRIVTIFSLDESKPPSRTVMKDWTKKQVEKFNAALAWIEQEESWDDKAQAIWENAR